MLYKRQKFVTQFVPQIPHFPNYHRKQKNGHRKNIYCSQRMFTCRNCCIDFRDELRSYYAAYLINCRLPANITQEEQKKVNVTKQEKGIVREANGTPKRYNLYTFFSHVLSIDGIVSNISQIFLKIYLISRLNI